MPRSNSPRAGDRRRVLAVLAATKRRLSYLTSHWKVSGEVYDSHPGGPKFMGVRRPRRADEYPENDAARWRELAAYADDIATAYAEVARQARVMAEEIGR